MSKPEHHRVLIAGGGSGGICVAARLAAKLPPQSVAIIEPSEHHYYQPLWTLVGGGAASRESTRRRQADFIPPGTVWIRDAVTEFDPEHNQVRTRDGKTIGYDFLVVALGIQLDWGKVKGLPENVGKDGVCSNYTYETVNSTWEFIRGFRGGNAIFTHPATPIKCGGAPQKIMYLADDAFRKFGTRTGSKIEFFIGDPVIFKVDKYARALLEVVKRKEIDVNYRHNLTELRTDTREAVFQDLAGNTEIVRKYDFLHVTPPMSAPEVVRKSGLVNDAGWVDVDKHTLQHARYKNIYAIGDCSSLPTSKTGAAIRKQAPVLTENLLHTMRAAQLGGKYDGYTSCPLVTGYGKLILAEFDYDLQPRETFPFDQSRERLSMYLLKKHVLPRLYWNYMLRGRA